MNSVTVMGLNQGLAAAGNLASMVCDFTQP